MIGRNILLKASTIENQSLVFVLRLEKIILVQFETCSIYFEAFEKVL